MLAIILVLLAAATNAAALVLLRKATEAEETGPAFSLRLLWLLVCRRPVWGAGIATIVAGFVLQVFALGNGPLSLVQLAILMELPFTLIGAWLVLGGRLHVREWSAIVAMTTGLVVALSTLAPTGGDPSSVNLLTWLIGLTVTVVIVFALLGIGQRSGSGTRTALFGAAAGAASGLIAVLAKTVAVTFEGGPASVIASWQTWALVAASIGGFLLLQNALQAGRLVASQPGISLANPVVALVWGIGLFHERVHTGWWLVGSGVGAALLAGGAVLLSRSPLLDPSTKTVSETADRSTVDGPPE
jgi:drug/metabolite transporter (DMT)-like permease